MVGRELRRVVLSGAVAAAAVAVLAQPAAAQPSTLLPDADLFCGPSYQDKVDEFVALPSAASQWVNDPVWGGHYLLLESSHYLAPGLLTEPVTDVSSLELLASKTYGSRAGLSADQLVQCEVVSRFAGDGVTVIAPITMVRVP